MPGARVDDGLLDVVVASPRSLGSWLTVGVYILTRQRFGHSALAELTGDRIGVEANQPVGAQLDGDPVGDARRVEATVRPAALRVRVPA